MPAEDFTNDYQEAQLEQHELIKEEGLNAWADALVGMLSENLHLDEDKAILIKQGLKAALGGPPRFNPSSLGKPVIFMPCPQVDAEFIEPEPSIFEQTDESGAITCWDWICLAARGTHSTLYLDNVTIFKGNEIVITLTGEAATRFWKWKTQTIKGLHIPAMPPLGPWIR